MVKSRSDTGRDLVDDYSNQVIPALTIFLALKP
jgi:hypothetical protein